jgi:putative ABC transport system permease protein
VDDRFIETNDFEFMRTATADAETEDVWSELQVFNEETMTVPIIGDYETLIWIYGGDVGSFFELSDDYGNIYTLDVIAIINSPIFAGSFIMAEENFDMIFPISGELKSFLGIAYGDPVEIEETLEWEFRDYGLAVTTVDEIALESTEFVSAYMSLFQLYLYFGLIVGISALGILSLKATSERRYEIGVLKAIGFRNRQVFVSFILENTVISGIGICLGAVTGILLGLLSYPYWGLSELKFTSEMAIFMLGIIISVLVITIILTLYPAFRASKLSSAEAMRKIE